MGKKPYLFAIVLLLFAQISAFGGGSSNKEPFTKKILNNFSFAELSKAYYYVDSTLILTRVLPHEERSVVEEGKDEGTITVVNGERVETIRIPDNIRGRMLSSDRGVLGVCFSTTNLDRILYFTEELIGTEFFLRASGSTVKYGQYDYKVNKKPKLLVQYTNTVLPTDRDTETETGW